MMNGKRENRVGMNQLPSDVLELISSYLDEKSLLEFSLVSKKTRRSTFYLLEKNALDCHREALYYCSHNLIPEKILMSLQFLSEKKIQTTELLFLIYTICVRVKEDIINPKITPAALEHLCRRRIKLNEIFADFFPLIASLCIFEKWMGSEIKESALIMGVFVCRILLEHDEINNIPELHLLSKEMKRTCPDEPFYLEKREDGVYFSGDKLDDAYFKEFFKECPEIEWLKKCSNAQEQVSTLKKRAEHYIKDKSIMSTLIIPKSEENSEKKRCHIL